MDRHTLLTYMAIPPPEAGSLVVVVGAVLDCGVIATRLSSHEDALAATDKVAKY